MSAAERGGTDAPSDPAAEEARRTMAEGTDVDPDASSHGAESGQDPDGSDTGDRGGGSTADDPEH